MDDLIKCLLCIILLTSCFNEQQILKETSNEEIINQVIQHSHNKSGHNIHKGVFSIRSIKICYQHFYEVKKILHPVGLDSDYINHFFVDKTPIFIEDSQFDNGQYFKKLSKSAIKKISKFYLPSSDTPPPTWSGEIYLISKEKKEYFSVIDTFLKYQEEEYRSKLGQFMAIDCY